MKAIEENVTLAPLTTIQLGGPARYFVRCTSVEELREALQWARDKDVRVHVLSGGSNTIFADAGFDGLVIKVDLRGVSFADEGDQVVVTAKAGEVWEDLVAETVRQNLVGFECLSGIPGSVGATPVQNVGAYGQDVSQTIIHVAAIDRETLEVVHFSNQECRFSYRQSRFKGEDADRYLIVEVTYRLTKNGKPTLLYQQVIDAVGEQPTLQEVREVVLNLRRSKSMVLDPNDPHTRSCGSFFMNPVLSIAEFAALQERWRAVASAKRAMATRRQAAGRADDIPSFPRGDEVTVPAAWFIEQAGFKKGQRWNNIGVSANHPLALVNYGGTTEELLTVAKEIQDTVREKFGVELVREPVVVSE